jgi:hypothetical protein
MSASHLYAGFRHAGTLPSIAGQRNVERVILSDLTADRCSTILLSVGCAFGDELNELLCDEPFERRRYNITAIDLAPVGDQILDQRFVSQSNISLEWHQLDLFDLAVVENYGSFDIAQAGFVLHDIDHSKKDSAFSLLAKSLRPSGYLILSEIFTSSASPEQNAPRTCYQEIEVIYDRLLKEADEMLRYGKLTKEQWSLLVGNGTEPGLQATREEATARERDYFETLEQTKTRLQDAGFRVDRVVPNPCNSYLSVIVAQAVAVPHFER